MKHTLFSTLATALILAPSSLPVLVQGVAADNEAKFPKNAKLVNQKCTYTSPICCTPKS